MNILAAIDFSIVSGEVINQAKALARAFEAKLWLLHVAEPDPDFVGYDPGPQGERDFIAKKYHKEHQQIQQYAADLQKTGVDVTPLLIQGAYADTILKEAQAVKADMIIVGSHGHGAVYHLLMGGVSEEVLKKSVCPVLVVPVKK